MEFYSHPEIPIILKSNPKNQKCFECGNSNPRWVSVNLGIFLCLKCAGIHKKYNNPNISLIRSLLVSHFDDIMINFLTLSGNEKLENFLKEYDLNTSKFEDKYKSKACEYYRQNLRIQIKQKMNKSNVSDIENLVKPSFEEGKLLMNQNIQPKENQGTDNKDNDEKPNSSEEEGMFGKVGYFLKKTGKKLVDNSSNFAGDISQKVKDLNIKGKIVQTGIKTVEYAKTTKTFVSDKANIVYVYYKIINFIIFNLE